MELSEDPEHPGLGPRFDLLLHCAEFSVGENGLLPRSNDAKIDHINAKRGGQELAQAHLRIGAAARAQVKTVQSPHQFIHEDDQKLLL